MITVSPNIDYAFIVALTVTLEDYLSRRRRNAGAGAGAGAGTGAGASAGTF